MKRYLSVLVSLFVIAAMMLSLASCDFFGGGDEKHEHTFSDKWSSNATNHWHAATCSDSNDCKEATKDLAAHTFGTDGKCTVCQYVNSASVPSETHKHTYAEEWSKDENGHWYAATCTDTADCATATKDYAAHSYNDETGLCICGQKKPTPVAGTVGNPLPLTVPGSVTASYSQGGSPIYYSFTATATETLGITLSEGTSIGYSVTSAADINEYTSGKTYIEVSITEGTTYYVAFFATDGQAAEISVSAAYVEKVVAGDLTGTYMATVELNGYRNSVYLNIVTNADLMGGTVTFATNLQGKNAVTYTYVVEEDEITISVYNGETNLSESTNDATKVTLTVTKDGLTGAFYNGYERVVSPAVETGYEGEYTLVSDADTSIGVEINSETFIVITSENNLPVRVTIPYTGILGQNFAFEAENADVTAHGILPVFDGAKLTSLTYDNVTYTIPVEVEEANGTQTAPYPITEFGKYDADADASHMIWYTFTADKSGYLTVKYPTANSWMFYHVYNEETQAWVDAVGSATANNVEEVKLEVVAGKTYKIGLGVYTASIYGTYVFSRGEGDNEVSKTVIISANEIDIDGTKLPYTLVYGLPSVEGYSFSMNYQTGKLELVDGTNVYAQKSFKLAEETVEVALSFEEAVLAVEGDFEKPYGFNYMNNATYTFSAGFAADKYVWFSATHYDGSWDYVFTFSTPVNVKYGYGTEENCILAEGVTTVTVNVEGGRTLVYIAVQPVDTSAEVEVAISYESVEPIGSENNPYTDVDVLGGDDVTAEGNYASSKKWYSFTATADGYLVIKYADVNNASIILFDANYNEVTAISSDENGSKFVLYKDATYKLGLGVKDAVEADFVVEISFAEGEVPYPGDFELPKNVYTNSEVEQTANADTYYYYTFNAYASGSITVDLGTVGGSIVYGVLGTAEDALAVANGSATFDITADTKYIVGVKVAEDVTFKFAFKGLPGTESNPIEVVADGIIANSATVVDSGVYFVYTPAANGTLTITVSSTNEAAYLMYYNTNIYWYDKVAAGASITLNVTKDKALELILSTVDDYGNYSDATKISFVATFEATVEPVGPTGFEGTYVFTDVNDPTYTYNMVFTATEVTIDTDSPVAYSIINGVPVIQSGYYAELLVFTVEDGKITGMVEAGELNYTVTSFVAPATSEEDSTPVTVGTLALGDNTVSAGTANNKYTFTATTAGTYVITFTDENAEVSKLAEDNVTVKIASGATYTLAENESVTFIMGTVDWELDEYTVTISMKTTDDPSVGDTLTATACSIDPKGWT